MQQHGWRTFSQHFWALTAADQRDDSVDYQQTIHAVVEQLNEVDLLVQSLQTFSGRPVTADQSISNRDAAHNLQGPLPPFVIQWPLV